MQFIDNIPLFVIFIVIIGFAAGCIETGFRFGEKHRLAGSAGDEPALGAIVASTLGLLAFLLAFTFNVATTRFDERRVAVLNEANAIGTTYLRAEFLESPQRERVKQLLREYVCSRAAGISVATRDEVMAKADVIQNELWNEAVSFGRSHLNSPVAALFISSLNETIDMHSKRVTLSLYARVPLAVWCCLFSVAGLSMTGVGYFCGLSGNRSWSESLILITTFGLVLLLVADLDRPATGFVRTSQQPMIDLCKKLEQH